MRNDSCCPASDIIVCFLLRILKVSHHSNFQSFFFFSSWHVVPLSKPFFFFFPCALSLTRRPAKTRAAAYCRSSCRAPLHKSRALRRRRLEALIKTLPSLSQRGLYVATHPIRRRDSTEARAGLLALIPLSAAGIAAAPPAAATTREEEPRREVSYLSRWTYVRSMRTRSRRMRARCRCPLAGRHWSSGDVERGIDQSHDPRNFF